MNIFSLIGSNGTKQAKYRYRVAGNREIIISLKDIDYKIWLNNYKIIVWNEEKTLA